MNDKREALAAPSHEAALKQVRWIERAYSLWAPVTVFGVVFAIYLVIVESSVCTYLSLQPVLKVFGLLCLTAWGALVGMRTLIKPFKQLRNARHLAEELSDEVDLLLKKHGATLKESAAKEMGELRAAVDVAMISPDAAAIRTSFDRLDLAVDKHLGKCRKAGVIDFGSGFVKALLVALAIRTLLIEPFKIPSGSMIPTLEIGDQIFVNKFIYGVRIPFTNFVPFQIVRGPKRGDVIVFNNPVVPEKDFIKRVIGVPGDTIEVEGRALKINGTPIDLKTEAEPYESWDDRGGGVWKPIDSALSRETLDGVPHFTMHGLNGSTPFDHNPVKVPPNAVFVMGDNRDNSEDSRFGLGGPGGRDHVEFVPFGNIKGKAMVIWFSWGHAGLFSQPFEGSGIRTDRFFLPVTMCGAEPPRAAAGNP